MNNFEPVTLREVNELVYIFNSPLRKNLSYFNYKIITIKDPRLFEIAKACAMEIQLENVRDIFLSAHDFDQKNYKNIKDDEPKLKKEIENFLKSTGYDASQKNPGGIHYLLPLIYGFDINNSATTYLPRNICTDVKFYIEKYLHDCGLSIKDTFNSYYIEYPLWRQAPLLQTVEGFEKTIQTKNKKKKINIAIVSTILIAITYLLVGDKIL